MELHALWTSDTAQVLISRWERARHPADREGCTRSAVIEFMRAGSYARRVPRNEVLIDPNHVAFFNPVEPFHVSHPCGDSNVGVTLRVTPAFLACILADIDRAAGCGKRPFRAPCAITSPRCHLLQDMLVDMLLSNDRVGEPAFIEEVLLDLIREAVIALYRPSGIVCDHGLRRDWRRIDRVENIRRYVMIHWAECLTLAKLADLVDCSTWHLASIFQACVGVPIHRYIKRLRLRHALARLHEGCTDLTRLALDCGFNSHSHFTAAFRQEFGTTPRAIRAARSAPHHARRTIFRDC
jgi:AraC-like DNA-binding protein